MTDPLQIERQLGVHSRRDRMSLFEVCYARDKGKQFDRHVPVPTLAVYFFLAILVGLVISGYNLMRYIKVQDLSHTILRLMLLYENHPRATLFYCCSC